MVRRKAGLFVIAAAMLAAGCSGGKQEEDSGALKVVSGFDSFVFASYFGGNQFELAHPNYKVGYVKADLQIGPNYWDDYVKLLDAEKPDVVAISNISDYYRLATAGLLRNLSPLIDKDGFDLDAVDPTIVSLLKYPGESYELFGLAPFFNPSAIYYNKTLFDTYGVPLPKNRMTWEEMLELASRFPERDAQGSRIYGYHHREFSTPSSYLDYISGIEGLSETDNERVTMDDAGWRRIIERTLQAFESHAVSYVPGNGEVRFDDPETGGEKPFLEGRVAMMQAEAPFIDKLAQSKAAFEWDVAPLFVSLDRGRSQPAYPSMIYAIYKDAANANAAWAYIRYMNDASTLKLLSKSVPQLPTRQAVGTERLGRSLEAFYAGTTEPPSISDANKKMIVSPFFHSQQLAPIIDEQFAQALADKKTVDEMIAGIQARGQQAYEQALADFRAAQAAR